MNLWLLLLFSPLAQCSGVCSCPDLCSCSCRSAAGADVVCSSVPFFPVGPFPPNTTRLSVQSSNLSSVASAHLSALPLLNDLQLYHTGLGVLPSDLLRVVPHLNMLDLTGNRLVHLSPNVFTHPSLRSLVLKNNLLEEADALWLSDNSSLTWLDLSGNRLSHVPAALLHKLKHLENLDLSHNNLQDLPADVLTNLHRLETLNLAGNKLTSLSPATFSDNRRLSQLFLQENRLRELPANLLQGLQRLQLLMLNQNELQHLPTGLLGGRSPTFRVILTRNPWLCDAQMKDLWKWLTAHPHSVFFLEEVTCAAPELLRCRQIFSLTDNELV